MTNAPAAALAIPIAALASAARSACTVCASRKVCLIGTVSEPHLSSIVPLLREVSFKNRDQLLIEGAVSDHIKIIKLGTVICQRRGPDGVQRPVALFGRGAVLGKYALVGHPNALEATALSAGRLCVLRVDELRHTQNTVPAFLAGFLAAWPIGPR
jgi:CRP-like cAMP-binding protein